jgi:hypothetical protein
VCVLSSDIPLLPVIGSKGDQQFNFQLHWLNNKELQFTMEAEVILQDMHKGVLNVDSHGDDHHHGNQEASDSEHEEDVEKSGKRFKFIFIIEKKSPTICNKFIVLGIYSQKNLTITIKFLKHYNAFMILPSHISK